MVSRSTAANTKTLTDLREKDAPFVRSWTKAKRFVLSSVIKVKPLTGSGIEV